jgi:hypothetical protein
VESYEQFKKKDTQSGLEMTPAGQDAQPALLFFVSFRLDCFHVFVFVFAWLESVLLCESTKK